jgi:hypothetical protein
MLARMMMVAQISTALNICLSTPLSREWISLANAGDPYWGLSPVEKSRSMAGPGLTGFCSSIRRGQLATSRAIPEIV